MLLRGKGWSIEDIATYSFVANLPWGFKLLYGAFSDAFPIRGLKRKPYIVLASLLSLAGWLGLTLCPHSKILLYVFGITANLGFAMTDVVTDALVVERSTPQNTQLYQSIAWGFRSFGAIVGGVLGGVSAARLPYRLVFGLTSVLPVITLLAGWNVSENRATGKKSLSHIWNPIFESVRALFTGDLRWFSCLFLVGSFAASFSTPFFFFLKENLQFSETFLGSLSSLAWLGAIAGCLLYGKFLREVNIKRMLYVSVLLNLINVLTTFWMVNRMSAIVLSVVGGVLGYISLLPMMAASALLARHKGIEGSLFALLMSVNNLGQIFAIFIGGKLFDIMGLKFLIVLSGFVVLGGFFFVARLRSFEKEKNGSLATSGADSF